MTAPRVPLFDLELGPEEEAALVDVLRSKWLSAGPRVAAFEQEFASALGVSHAVAVANGTAALHLAMLAAGIGPGDEVIVPSLTFVATVNAARYVGAQPVFVDVISAERPVIDPAAIAAAITPRSRAVVVMHYGGFPCDMPEIDSVANQHGLQIIEDACHALLSEQGGRKLGSIGSFGCFSFFSNKNMTTAEGGMVVTANSEAAHRLRLLRSHGMTTLSYDRARGHASGYDVLELGFNYRMDDLRAALGLVQLRRMPEDIARRAGLRAAYEEALAGIPGLLLPFRGDNAEPRSNHLLAIVLEGSDRQRRDAVREALQLRGVQTSVHYPPAHRFGIYAGQTATLPVTERLGESLVTLPFYRRMGEAELTHVVTALRQALAA
jgi:dTDP-4-amino-4,6-dideoxygalactose transaminase